jgi:hypothetical protein
MSFVFIVSISSQPGSGNGFSLKRNLVYNVEDTTAYYLDLYTPGGQAMLGGIGVSAIDTKLKTSENEQVVSTSTQ